MRMWMSSVILAGAMLVPASAVPASRHAAPVTPKAAQAKPIVPESEKSDQTLRDAINQLEGIKSRVHAAAHEYGGHRGKADQYMERAIEELRAALKFEEEHEKK